VLSWNPTKAIVEDEADIRGIAEILESLREIWGSVINRKV